MDISCIALTSLFASPPMVPVVVYVVVDVVVVAAVGNLVAIGPVGANFAANVEGTVVVTLEMIVGGALSRVAYLSWIKLSSSFSFN